MLTFEQYFGPWLHCHDATPGREYNAHQLIDLVNPLLLAASDAGIDLPTNPVTGSNVAGQRFGGFRPQACKEGAPNSSHKEGQGVDIFDPTNALDNWLTDEILRKFGLYREHPDATPGWCHLTDRAPPSGRRTFRP